MSGATMLGFIRCQQVLHTIAGHVGRLWRANAEGAAGPAAIGRQERLRGHGGEDRYRRDRRYTEHGARPAQERAGWGESSCGEARDRGAPRDCQKGSSGEVEMTINKRDLTLAVLAAADGRPYTPVQLQKALFLITENLRAALDSENRFNFRAYDYGPFDEQVYREAESLKDEGLASISLGLNGRWKEYAATSSGVASGRKVLEKISEDQKRYIEQVSSWVRSQSFGSLVKSIYDAYPDMKANSIFQY